MVRPVAVQPAARFEAATKARRVSRADRFQSLTSWPPRDLDRKFHGPRIGCPTEPAKKPNAQDYVALVGQCVIVDLSQGLRRISKITRWMVMLRHGNH